VGRKDDVLFDESAPLEVVGANGSMQAWIEYIVNIVVPDDIPLSCTRDIDRRPISQNLCHAVHLIVFHHVVAGVQVGHHRVPFDHLWIPIPANPGAALLHLCRVFDLVPANAPRAFPHIQPSLWIKEPGPYATEAYRFARHVVNAVVRDMVLSALPDNDPVRVPVDLSAVMDVVVQHLVLLVHILGARAIPNEDYPRAP